MGTAPMMTRFFLMIFPGSGEYWRLTLPKRGANGNFISGQPSAVS